MSRITKKNKLICHRLSIAPERLSIPTNTFAMCYHATCGVFSIQPMALLLYTLFTSCILQITKPILTKKSQEKTTSYDRQK